MSDKRQKHERHGMTDSPLYATWLHMIRRCHCETSEAYGYYGARGISVCQEWQDSFKTFAEHVSALTNCKADGYTLDRIDNDGNYEPGNVRWATWTEQLNNRRVGRMVTYKGRTQSVSVWSREIGIGISTIQNRLYSGWDAEAALSTPVRGKENSTSL